jgi:hypothetical protein
MLMHITQLTEDDSYEYEENFESVDSYINVHLVESVVPDDDDADRCFVYMQSEDYFHIDESMDHFIQRYQSVLYGSVLTKFYDKTNRSQ